MFAPLPQLIDPWRAVEAGAEFRGSLPLGRMARLREALRASAGEARFRLAFSRDQEKRGVLGGEIEARLILTCQRCLEALEFPVLITLDLVLVSGLDEAGLLPEDLDPLLVSAEPLRLADLIEDELLLALPQIPRHEPGECPAIGQGWTAGAEEQPATGSHPFAVLGDLKRKPAREPDRESAQEPDRELAPAHARVRD
jgi:uncharacterized protein